MIPEIILNCTIDAGHRIVGHKGKCARIHGHTYRIMVKASGEIREPGFVVDFGDIKEVLNLWDHKMLLWDHDPFVILERTPGSDANFHEYHDAGVVRLPFNPTAENMASHLAQELGRRFSLNDCQVTVWETPSCSAVGYWARGFEPNG